MRLMTGTEERESAAFMEEAAMEAAKSTCLEARCGSIIAKNGKVIGRGFNSPPGNLESQRRCNARKSEYAERVTDKTCCMHAEQRAIMDALRSHPGDVAGARLYFTRINAGGALIRSGKPYCTICSKMALDSGISEFVLWHDDGICAYGTEEYNGLSFRYRE